MNRKKHNNLSLDAYIGIVPQLALDNLRKLGGRLQGTRIQHINSTRSGGGVAEILHKLVPLMRDLGLDTTWDVIEGDKDFFRTTKKFHNALHGSKEDIGEDEIKHYLEVNRSNSSLPRKDAHIIIHDPQPLALVKHFEAKSGRYTIWRCHIDISHADDKLWRFMARMIDKFSASIFSMPEFSRPLEVPQYLITPSIDPISNKNKPLESAQVRKILEKFGIDPRRPIITQISRFDRLKDPFGVVSVYRVVKKIFSNLQLVLAGGAADDDPEGQEVLAELLDYAGNDPDIHIINLPPFSDIEINAIVRGSTIILQKSVREGFGLTVTEALWKRKPVIATVAGGIKRQVIHNATGLLAHSTEGFAFQVRRLLSTPGLARRLGRAAKAHVAENFLITQHLRDYLLLFLALRDPGAYIVYL